MELQVYRDQVRHYKEQGNTPKLLEAYRNGLHALLHARLYEALDFALEYIFFLYYQLFRKEEARQLALQLEEELITHGGIQVSAMVQCFLLEHDVNHHRHQSAAARLPAAEQAVQALYRAKPLRFGWLLALFLSLAARHYEHEKQREQADAAREQISNLIGCYHHQDEANMRALGGVLLHLGHASLCAHKYTEAEDLLQRALSLLHPRLCHGVERMEQLVFALMDGYTSLAYVYHNTKQQAKAKEPLVNALYLYDRHRGADYAHCHAALATRCLIMGRYCFYSIDEQDTEGYAVYFLNKAMEIDQSMVARQIPARRYYLAFHHFSLALILQRKGEERDRYLPHIEKAERILAAIEDREREELAQQLLDLYERLESLCTKLQLQERLVSLRQMQLRLMSHIAEKQKDAQSLDKLIRKHINLVRSYPLDRTLSETEKCFHKARRLCADLQKQNEDLYYDAAIRLYNSMGYAYLYHERWEAAEEAFETAYRLSEERFDQLSDSTRIFSASSAFRLGLLYDRRGRATLAIRHMLRATEIAQGIPEATQSTTTANLAFYYVSLGDLYQKEEDPAAAAAMYEQAKALYEGLAQREPDIYAPELAVLCLTYAKLTHRRSLLKEAYDAAKKAPQAQKCKEVLQKLRGVFSEDEE